jgi:hypothetical protein
LSALMIQVGLDGALASVSCCDSHAEMLTRYYGFSIVKCYSISSISSISPISIRIQTIINWLFCGNVLDILRKTQIESCVVILSTVAIHICQGAFTWYFR